MSELRVFDPKKVVGNWDAPAGSVAITDGKVSGEFISMSHDNAAWTREFDGDGNATRVRNHNAGGSFTITLSASSPINDQLQARFNLDIEGTPQVGDMVLSDKSGSGGFIAKNAFIEKAPDMSYGQERGTRTWVFQAAKIEVVAKGHALATSSL